MTRIDYTERVAMIGVFVNGKPAGRIRQKEDGFRAYTNRREPGHAHVGTFPTREKAGEAIAAFNAEDS